jgi:hypothetical protein
MHRVVCGVSWLLRVIDHEAALMDPKLFSSWVRRSVVLLKRRFGVWTADKQPVAIHYTLHMGQRLLATRVSGPLCSLLVLAPQSTTPGRWQAGSGSGSADEGAWRLALGSLLAAHEKFHASARPRFFFLAARRARAQGPPRRPFSLGVPTAVSELCSLVPASIRWPAHYPPPLPVLQQGEFGPPLSSVPTASAAAAAAESERVSPPTESLLYAAAAAVEMYG